MPTCMFRRFIRAALLAFACTAAFAQKTIHVPADQPTIQAGINAANTGDTVLVAPGTYYENLTIDTKEIVIRSSDGAAKTILDGSKIGVVVTITNTPSLATTIDGFTIRNGHTPFTPSDGGIFLRNAGATIQNNTISGNYGWGIDANISSINALSNHFVTTAPDAGQPFCSAQTAIYLFGNLRGFTPAVVPDRISGNLIEGDGSSCSGTGVYGLAFDSGQIDNNVIRNNLFGISIYANSATVRQNLIYGNEQGGLYAQYELGVFPKTDPPAFFIVNNTLFNNLTNLANEGGYLQDFGEVVLDNLYAKIVLSNNLIIGNSSTSPTLSCQTDSGAAGFADPNDTPAIIDHNDIININANPSPAIPDACADIHPTQIGLDGNISVNPLFVSATDFHLSPGSPAIDSGNNSAINLLPLDLSGDPRILDSTGDGYPVVDMGVYEAPGLLDAAPIALALVSTSYYVTPGTSITLTATPSATGGAPGGIIGFLQDDKPIGSATVAAGGTSSQPVTLLAPGLYRFKATYNGPAGYAPAVSTVLYIRVTAYVPRLTLTSTPNPSILGQTVTFNFNISSQDTNQLGPITLSDGGTTIATVNPDPTGAAVFTTSSLALGFHQLLATYIGDNTHAQATANLVQQVVSGFTTTTSLVSSLNPSNISQNVTFTASLSSSNGTPTGSIQFSDGATILATQPVNSSGVATYSTGSLTVGSHPITATYIPTGIFAASSASLTQVVQSGYATSTTLTSSPNPSISGQSVTFTAAVTSVNGTPSGSIQFIDNGTPIGTSALNASGIATFSTATLTVGDHNITATYIPTGTFAGSTTSITQTVSAITNTVNITSSLNPSTFGQSITITAHVASNAGLPAFGPVVFYDGNYLGSQVIDPSGNASYTTSTLAVGAHNITAIYTPSGSSTSFSASYVQQVNGLPTSTLLTATPSTGYAYITPITVTATVTPASSGGSTPGGPIIFYVNGAQFATASLVNGIATFTGIFPAGIDQIYAAYIGDPTYVYSSSTSNTVAVTITAAPSTLLFVNPVTTEPALATFSIGARLSITGAGTAPVGHPVTITVTPITGLSPAVTATLTTDKIGALSLPISLLPGTYTVAATFAGTPDLQPTTATPFIVTVLPNPTVTALSVSPNPAFQNAPVTFTATVTATTGTNSASGTLTLYDIYGTGTIAVPIATQTLPLSATIAPPTTTAAFTISTLAPGIHRVFAVYAPTVSFAASQSLPLTLTILPQSFTLTLSDPTLTLQTGHHHAETVSLTSIGGLTATFTHSCAALPPYVSCLWSQSSVTLPANGTVSTSMTIDTDQLPGFLASTNKPGAPFTARTLRGGWAGTTLAFMLPLTLLNFKRRSNLRSLLSVMLLAILATTVTACGANHYPASTPPGTYIIPITAAGTSAGHTYTQTVNLTLIVTP
jgi:hypothetical protein